MGARIVVDPVTRIEGHLRIEAEVKDGKIGDAFSAGTMVRGIANILRGRDPRDAWAITERVCGVCTTVHALASVRAVEDALGIRVPPTAELVRNLMFCAQYLQDHVVHFYHLHALDWVDVVSALKADPRKTSQEETGWRWNSVSGAAKAAPRRRLRHRSGTAPPADSTFHPSDQGDAEVKTGTRASTTGPRADAILQRSSSQQRPRRCFGSPPPGPWSRTGAAPLAAPPRRPRGAPAEIAREPRQNRVRLPVGPGERLEHPTLAGAPMPNWDRRRPSPGARGRGGGRRWTRRTLSLRLGAPRQPERGDARVCTTPPRQRRGSPRRREYKRAVRQSASSFHHAPPPQPSCTARAPNEIDCLASPKLQP